MEGVINTIIEKILERTDERWFIQHTSIPTIPIPVKKLLTDEYTALLLQMFLTMVHPRQVIRFTPTHVYSLFRSYTTDNRLESMPARPETKLHHFIANYLLYLRQNNNLAIPEDFVVKRYTGPISETENKVSTVDLVRAHYWLLKHVQGNQLPSATYYIIGAGGVGWWIAEFVNMFSRNSKIVIYDFDSIEPHNFNRLPLSYLVLLEKDDLRKALLLREKLQPIASMNSNDLITIPTAFTERQLEGLKRDAENVDQLFFIEATDSPKFQLWIRKAIKELGKDNIWLIQGHYDTRYPNLWGHVEAYPPELIPQPEEREIDQASDYAEGQSIGLPPFLVADVIRLLVADIAQSSERRAYEFGPFILTEQQLNAFKGGVLL